MRLRTMGGLELVNGGPTAVGPRPLLLLAYLCLEGVQERRHLAELFWPGGANPMGNLATVLVRLRKAGERVVQADDLKVWTALPCDAAELLLASDKGVIEKVLDLYQGRFVEGFYLKDVGAELEEWVYRTRELLAGRMRAALLRTAEADALKGQFEFAAKRAEQAYLLSGAPEPESADLERLYALMLAGGSFQAAEVRKEAEGFGVSLSLAPEEARQQLRGSKHAMHNLPSQSTPFVGRSAELAALDVKLGDPYCRLLTIAGPGGTGKTRLAIEAALGQVGRFKDGVYFVSLVPVRSASAMTYAVSDAVGSNLLGHEAPLTQLIHHLEDKNVLLVLDNLEHLLADLTLIQEVLENTPNVKVLGTSREPLNFQAEHVFDLQGLDVPEQTTHIESYDAVKLFIQSARRRRTDFAVDDSNAAAVSRICQLVEGLPLALELAASWLRTLSPDEIASEIEQGIDLLEGTIRDLPERHQSIRAVFDYSWALLTEQEQTVLCKLSVFQGGFRRGAAAEVAGASLPILAGLVDRSLLRAGPGGRYHRHPLVITYTRERLAEDPEEEERTRDHHARYFLTLAEETELQLRGSHQAQGYERFEAEHDNLRAALDWYRTSGQAESGLRLSASMWPFWGWGGYLDEAREQLSRALSQPGASEPTKSRVHALNCAGYVAYSRGDVTSARALLEEGLAVSRVSGYRQNMADSLQGLGELAHNQGDYAAAHRFFEESAAIYRELGDRWGLSVGLRNLGSLLTDQADYVAARRLYEESLAISRELEDKAGVAGRFLDLGFLAFFQADYATARSLYEESLVLYRELNVKSRRSGVATVLYCLGDLALAQADYATARSFLEQSLSINQELGDRWIIPLCLHGLGDVAFAAGDYATARPLFVRSLAMLAQLKEKHSVTFALESLAALAAAEGQPERAANLFGAAEALRERVGTPLPPKERQRYDKHVAAARDQIDKAGFKAAWRTGRALTIEQATALVMNQDLPQSSMDESGFRG